MAEKVYEFIESASDCNIKRFMAATFENKLKALITNGNPSEEEYKELEPKLQNAFEYIYAQYVDISGLYLSQEFELVGYINSLNHRITTMKWFVELQNKFMDEFEVPYLPGLSIAERYGYKLYWDPNYPESFIRKLNSIPAKESKFTIRITEKTKELVELRKKQIKKEHTLLESRKDFITMMNRLQQHKFVIDKNETTVEELALMIKDQRDQVETDNMNRKFKK